VTGVRDAEIGLLGATAASGDRVPVATVALGQAVSADPGPKEDRAATAGHGLKGVLVELRASPGIPGADPDVMDPVVAPVGRISVQNP
jgi:hypothetical protein